MIFLVSNLKILYEILVRIFKSKMGNFYDKTKIESLLILTLKSIPISERSLLLRFSFPHYHQHPKNKNINIRMKLMYKNLSMKKRIEGNKKKKSPHIKK